MFKWYTRCKQKPNLTDRLKGGWVWFQQMHLTDRQMDKIIVGARKSKERQTNRWMDYKNLPRLCTETGKSARVSKTCSPRRDLPVSVMDAPGSQCVLIGQWVYMFAFPWHEMCIWRKMILSTGIKFCILSTLWYHCGQDLFTFVCPSVGLPYIVCQFNIFATW